MDLAGRVLDVLKDVPDPEIPAVSVLDLGIVRGLSAGERPCVRITPTYTGCPATLVIQATIRQALDAAGFEDIGIVTELAPPWTTDWITDEGREKLRLYGIAPPPKGDGRGTLREAVATPCPRCASTDTEEISRFGSTPCKALMRCRSCAEPFDRFKCH